MAMRFLFLLAMVLAAILGLVLGIFESITWAWAYPALTLGFFLVVCALAFGWLMILCKRVDQSKPQDKDDPLYRWVAEQIVESVLPILRIDVKTKGLNKIPTNERFLLVCNHCSLADPVVLLGAFAHRQVAFISKKENKDMFVVGPIMHKMYCQLIDRENDREALKTILKCISILKEDEASIGVFPEGYIHDDLKLHRFRPGVFKIAQKAQVPIVVCTLKGTKDVLPNLPKWKHTDVELNLLEVIPAEELADVTTTEIADRIYQLMADDLGPENVSQEQNT